MSSFSKSIVVVVVFGFKVHSFDGTRDDVISFTGLGFYIGINGW
jgi:Tat protein secretion system quality control protein TatD with DNase activity